MWMYSPIFGVFFTDRFPKTENCLCNCDRKFHMEHDAGVNVSDIFCRFFQTVATLNFAGSSLFGIILAIMIAARPFFSV